MSENSIALNNGQQAIINTDLKKIFVLNNRYASGSYTNSVYDPETLYAGQLMGRVSATQKLVKLFSGSTDGSQYPVGILAQDIQVEEGSTVTLSICVAGDVEESKILFETNDNLSTVISGRSIRDRIAADTVGIKLVSSTEMTAYDNQ